MHPTGVYPYDIQKQSKLIYNKGTNLGSKGRQLLEGGGKASGVLVMVFLDLGGKDPGAFVFCTCLHTRSIHLAYIFKQLLLKRKKAQGQH